MFDYAVRYLQNNQGVGIDFEVGEAELAELFDQLQAEHGLSIERETFERAARYVGLDLEQEIALQGWGEIGEFQRRIPYDNPLQTALDLLRMADSQEDLFSRASWSPTAQPQAVSATGIGR